MAADGRKRHERQTEGMCEAADAEGVHVHPVEQEGIRVQVEIEQEGTTQAETQGFDTPTEVGRHFAEQLFDQQQTEDAHRQRDEQGSALCGHREVDAEDNQGLRAETGNRQQHGHAAEPTQAPRPWLGFSGLRLDQNQQE